MRARKTGAAPRPSASIERPVAVGSLLTGSTNNTGGRSTRVSSYQAKFGRGRRAVLGNWIFLRKMSSPRMVIARGKAAHVTDPCARLGLGSLGLRQTRRWGPFGVEAPNYGWEGFLAKLPEAQPEFRLQRRRRRVFPYLGLKNFRAFESVELTLKPITVVVGPNNAGKSSLLSGLRVLSQTASSQDFRVPLLLNGILGDLGTDKDFVFQNKKRMNVEISAGTELWVRRAASHPTARVSVTRRQTLQRRERLHLGPKTSRQHAALLLVGGGAVHPGQRDAVFAVVHRQLAAVVD